MPTTIDALRLRAVLGRKHWQPPERFGPDGWRLVHRDGAASVIVTAFPAEAVDLPEPLGPGMLGEWLHASMTRPDAVPTYEDLCRLKDAVWGPRGWAYHYFAPTGDHINIHPRALHLWGRADGAPLLPNFAAAFGSI